MKKYIFKLIIIPVLFFASLAGAQTYDYTVNWSDTSTFKTTCGKVVPAQWSVKNDSCVMTTPYLRVEAPQGCVVSFNFRINQSGNGDPSDKCYVFHQIDNGIWELDTFIIAGGSPAVYPVNDSVYLKYSHFIKFKICMVTDSKTEFWAIKAGDLVVSDGFPGVQNLSSWAEEPPLPLDTPPMPIELIWVQALTDNDHVDISWATESETNNDYFTIEKSMDAVYFKMVTTVDGAGNSNILLNYSAKDNEPLPNVSYYRLKQTDFDGKYTYSEIKVVKFTSDDSGFSVFPNPLKSGEILQVVPVNSINEYKATVLSASGQKISEYSAKGSSSLAIDQLLPVGFYYIILSTDNEKIIEKIVVQ